MAELREKQFELGGVVFGLQSDNIEVVDWTPGGPALRTSDADMPTGDGVRFGRDLKGSATWNFSMYVDGEDEEDAWAKLARLAEVWDDDWVREEPDRVVPLRYRVAGETRVVYGRPRAWSPLPNNLSLGGRIDVEAQFVLVDHRAYGDTTNAVPISLGIPFEADAGLIPPFIVPFTSNAGASERVTSVSIGGTTRTPVWVKFLGPVSNAALRIGGWTASVSDFVDPADPVTVDGRPWIRAATKESGGGVRVNPRVTRISQMWLPPGDHQIIFTGEDVTGSASALVSWQDAYRTPR